MYTILIFACFSMVEPEEESDADDEPYLHPSLAPSFTKIEAVSFIIQYTRYCTYINLLLKINKSDSSCALGKILCSE